MRRSEAGTKRRTVQELVDHFDTYDMGQEWERMPEAQFDVDIRTRTRLLPIDEDLAARVSEIARSRKVRAQDLVDGWLREKIGEYPGTP